MANSNSEEELIWLATRLFKESPDAIIVADDQGTIRFVNMQTELLFGYHATEMEGQPVSMLVPEDKRTRHDEHVARYAENPQLRPMGMGLIVAGRRKSGVEIPVEINLSPLSTPYGMRVIATIRRRPHHQPPLTAGESPLA